MHAAVLLLALGPLGEAEPPSHGPQTPAAEPSVTALRVRETVNVDGLLDEPAWSAAGAASGFRQREPKEGERASEETEVRVLYDDTMLYVGVAARDREPGEVIARILQRDRIVQAGLDNLDR